MPRPSHGPAEPLQSSSDERTAETRRRIGDELRQLRLERGLTLKQAAGRAGLSRSFIGMVENGQSEIAFSRLIRLVNAYGVLTADLLARVERPAAGAEFTPADRAEPFPSGTAGVEIDYLSSSGWPMQPFRVRIQPGARLDGLSHPGVEFIHCVKGRPILVVDEREYSMRAGDTIMVPEYAKHCYLNETDRPAQLVGAVDRAASAQPTPQWRVGSDRG
jgi:transcriptional regulator with XRE-family HTH domain